MASDVETAVIIVAAGRGIRAGRDVPKQWQLLAGATVLGRAVSLFQGRPGIGRIVVVIHPDDAARPVPAGVTVVHGGATRGASVRAGLAVLAADPPGRVLIHDAARPLTDPALIGRVIAALDGSAAAAPGLAITDALWRGTGGAVSGTQDRTGLYAAQTPQGFDFASILAAYGVYEGDPADDVAVARAAGMTVAIVPGDPDNFKITMPGDFDRAERLLGNQMDIRVGNGFDVHRFGPGDHVWLCGVKIPHDRGLRGHSDADVGLHALTDAIYGALGQGDIGQHFPPTDPQWKGAASHIFLHHACDLARSKGFAINHVDCTLICEHPKIGPHALAMKEEMSRIMQIAPDRISVKATTTERLGATGRGEGIAAMATATLVAR
jgi:2-C-methyl-D-erythritol 4-phosphate cytidylyltransferase/2-C-methyl-D-erythritol 2,4-cyclodiphosphate synthase